LHMGELGPVSDLEKTFLPHKGWNTMFTPSNYYY
jgi:hypothetical protein